MHFIDQFKAEMTAWGIVPPDEIQTDGKLHRFGTGKSSWYILFHDERPAGKFGCWRQGISQVWKSNERKPWTAAERAEFRAKVLLEQKRRAAEKQAERDECAATANRMWSSAAPASGDHAYLQRKEIEGLSARVLNGELLVPLRTDAKTIVGLQRISADGTKLFLRGSPMELHPYCVIGTPSRAPGLVVFVCEGYATGISLHLATGAPVVVAFNAGNLDGVAMRIRAAMQDCDLVICADDDAFTVYPQSHPDAGKPWNPGREAAVRAACSANATVAIPVWRGARGRGTDFNDLCCAEGFDAVTRCINNALNPSDALPDGEKKSVLTAEESVKPASDATAAGFPVSSPMENNTGSTSAVNPSCSDGVSDIDSPALSATDGLGDSLGGFELDGYEFIMPDDDDVFIFSSDPMDAAKKFQVALPHDGKVIFWRGDFYTWNGYRYAERDAVYLHKLLYEFMARCMTHKTNPKTGETEVVAFTPNKTSVENCMHALRAVCYIELDEPPCWIVPRAGDVPAGEIIAFRNGFLHAPTRRLMPSNPRLFTISALDFDYNAQAPEPTSWLAFLNGLWGEDAESVEALADMFGYLLTDDTSQQKAFMMIGPPRSGKGTILRVLESMVGSSNRVSPSLAGIGGEFGLWPLIGKRVAMISDARLSGKADQQPIVENLLRITGEDAVTINRKSKSFWSGKLSTRFVVAANETPSFSDASSALANRFIMFKFKVSFLGREDKTLTNRLQTELPGIILWALDGLDRLRKRGYLLTPEAGRELSDEMREQGSPIMAFVADKCVLGDGNSIPRKELYDEWRVWCARQGMDHPGAAQSFGRKLTAAIPGIGRTQPMEYGERVNSYSGIRLLHRTEI